ncbi:NLI interacting factor-like phosphatase-domain-containing protein [Coemansia spiralis]|nr:NLI interacting factor-like phosphatase-domain-containing protein [Coemansia spiralis]
MNSQEGSSSTEANGVVKNSSNKTNHVPSHLRNRYNRHHGAQQRTQHKQLHQPSSVLLPANRSEWEDKWVLADYAQNERATAHKELIVLDLNGTLLKREKHRKDKTRMAYARPHLPEFLAFAVENFAVMVWSSAQPGNINNMLEGLMSPYYKSFVRVWDRRFCQLDGRYFGKSSSLKDLRRITDGFTLMDSSTRNAYGTYDGYLGICPEKRDHWKMENVILVDDSKSKAAQQKGNHIFISSYDGPKTNPDDDELLKFTDYLKGYLARKSEYSDLLSYLSKHSWPEFRTAGSASSVSHDKGATSS